MADRLIAWLDHCGYEILEKKPERTAALVTDDARPHLIGAR
ncbi:hypothetical protein [Bradyrhizobium sp. SZCCHNR3107]